MHAVVDHRPRALEISAFTESDREDLLPHFAVCGNFFVLWMTVFLFSLDIIHLETLFRNEPVHGKRGYIRKRCNQLHR